MLKEGYYFPEQRKEEQIIRFIHRRWLAFWPWIIFLGLMVFLPVIIFIVGRNIIISSFGPEDIRYFVAGLSAYYLVTLAIFLTSWIGHYLNVVLITPDRLIDIRQNGLFNRVVAEQSLLRVQDVSARMDGFFQTFFLYGTVIVETAGESPNFVIPDLPTPNEVANTILKLHEDLVKKSGFDGEDMSSGVGLEAPSDNLKKQYRPNPISNKLASGKEFPSFGNHSSPETKPVTEEIILPEHNVDKKFNSEKFEVKQEIKSDKPKNIEEPLHFKSVSKPEKKQIPKNNNTINKPIDLPRETKNIPREEKHIVSGSQEGDLIDGIQIKL